MTPELLFTFANGVAAASWLLLIVLPARRWVAATMTGRVVPALLAAAYAAIVFARFGAADGGFSSLAGVARLFADPWLLLAGWLHYLAFDLLGPCLLTTFLFGPAGWLLYIAVRAGSARGRSAPLGA